MTENEIAGLLTYLHLTGCRHGLLINFGENLMKDGFKRVANVFKMFVASSRRCVRPILC